MLRQGRPTNIDMPGFARNLNGLTFACASMDRRDAMIRISADVGRESFGHGLVVGEERGRGDVEMTYVGLRGRHVDSIALMPVNADARCSGVTARFDNGRSQMLNLRNGNVLRRGVYTQVDLPGNYRNLDSIALRCRAAGANSVTIKIYASL